MCSQLQDSISGESPRIPLKKTFLSHNTQFSSTNKSSHRGYKYFTTLHVLHPINQASPNKRFEKQLGRIRYSKNFCISNQLDLSLFQKTSQQIRRFSKTTKTSSDIMPKVLKKGSSYKTVSKIQKKTFKWTTNLSESQLHHDISLQSLKYLKDLHTLRLNIVGPRAEYDSLNSFIQVGASLKSLVSLEISSTHLSKFFLFFETLRGLPNLRELIVKSQKRPETIEACSFVGVTLKRFVLLQEGISYTKHFILENLSKAVHLDEIDIRAAITPWSRYWGCSFLGDYESEDKLKRFLESHGYGGIRKIPRPKKKREFHFKDSRVTLIASGERFYLKKHDS